jgi:TRAP-type C4-dicarboxylate transport system permease small subunit
MAPICFWIGRRCVIPDREGAAMENLSRITMATEYVVKKVIAILFALIGIIITIQVITRYCFSFSFAWSEEFIKILAIWVTMLATTIGVRRKTHISVSAFEAMLPRLEIFRLLFKWAPYIACFFFYGILFYIGVEYSKIGVSILTPTFKISAAWMYAAVPTASLVSLMFLIEQAAQEINSPKELVK